MKILLFLLSLFLFFSCSSKKEAEENNTTEKELHEEEIKAVEEKPTEVSFPIKNIELNPRYTWEENIYAIWNKYLGGAQDKIDYIYELSDSFKREGVFIISTKDEKTSYFTLMPGQNGTYVLNFIKTSSISVLHQYGRRSTATITPYDISIDYGDVDGLVVSYQIYGMKGAPDGEGMMPFQKVQHDYFTFDKENNLVYNISETEAFNERVGVNMTDDSSLGIHDFLFQKYYSPFNKELKSHLLDMILDDMDILTTGYQNRDNIFEPVLKQEDGTYVNDQGNVGYEAFFVSKSNDMNLEDINSSDYPILYVEDHGSYYYSITDIKVDDKEIIFNLKKLNASSENTETSMYVDMMHLGDKWLMVFVNNNYTDRLMMEKDRKNLMTINSDEGQ